MPLWTNDDTCVQVDLVTAVERIADRGFDACAIIREDAGKKVVERTRQRLERRLADFGLRKAKVVERDVIIERHHSIRLQRELQPESRVLRRFLAKVCLVRSPVHLGPYASVDL